MRPKHKKTEWGVKLNVFCSKYGLTLTSVAEQAGVKRSVVYAASVGRTAGYETIAKLDSYMEQYERIQHAALIAELEAAKQAFQ